MSRNMTPVGGTPPTLWPSPHARKVMALDASITKLVYKHRLKKLAAQVEKLSFMIEHMDIYNCYSEESEAKWLER